MIVKPNINGKTWIFILKFAGLISTFCGGEIVYL